MADFWDKGPNLRVTTLFMSSSGDQQDNFWVRVANLPPVGELGPWRRIDGEVKGRDRDVLMQMLIHAKDSNSPVWILDEVFLGHPTGYIKGCYVW